MDLWGPQRFRVVVDGKVVGETTGTSLVPDAARCAPGAAHLPGDRRSTARPGSAEPHAARAVRHDGADAQGHASSASARAGRALRIVGDARRDKGSGVRDVRVDYGDSKRVVKQRGKRFRGRHAYRRGRFTLQVTGYDNAGNRRVKNGQAAHHVRLRAGRRGAASSAARRC